jgi:DNA-directed RNA polymerase subunit M/transcription elongation factor TFIIS
MLAADTEIRYANHTSATPPTGHISMTTWSDVPTLFLPRLRCPKCGTFRTPLLTRSADGGDNSISRKYTCRECGVRFLVVCDPELPILGMDDFPLPYHE